MSYSSESFSFPLSASPGQRRSPSKWELLIAFFLFLVIPLLYSTGQEVIAYNYVHDDYYFLKKSNDYKLEGLYLAHIREYLYPFFIDISRTLGLGLRNTEVLCLGLGLFWLWNEIFAISQSRWISWGSVFPLLFFTYQHPLFNRATYDALQLILTPLTIASSLYLITSRMRLRALILAGVIVGLHTLTRPEGFTYMIPPLAALLFTTRYLPFPSFFPKLKPLLGGGILIAGIPWIFVQGNSFFNYTQYGFWGTTIIRSQPYHRSLKALMSIDPEQDDYDPYRTLSIAALEKGFEVSPHLRATRAFFSENLNGKGWSRYGYPGYLTTDGSVPGGNVQWAWLEAVASIAGSQPDTMLAYHQKVADELEAAFHQGILKKRTLLSTALGPNVSPLRDSFYKSLFKISLRMAHWTGPDEVLPLQAREISDSEVERDYNRFALRRKGLVDDQYWQKLGWLADPSRGLPTAISLDTPAQEAKIVLELVSRPDVVRALFPKLSSIPEGKEQIGFLLAVRGDASGNILIQYEGDSKPVRIPILSLRHIQANHNLYHNGTQIRIDDDYGNSGFAYETDRWLMGITKDLTYILHYLMRGLILLAICTLPLVWFFSRNLSSVQPTILAFHAITLVTLSLIFTRLITLSALDAWVTLAFEPRYMASGVLALWLLTTSTLTTASYVYFTGRKKSP